MKKLGYWKSRKEWKRLTQGMSPDQVTRLKQSLSQGDEATLAAITEIQAEQRGHLKEYGLDYDKVTPEIGKDIAWSDILSMAFRIIDFDRNGTVITNSGDVKAKSLHEPYGYLLVDAPTLNQPVGLPISHRDDFLLAASVFDDPDVMHVNEQQGREFLVTYQPQKTTKDGRSASPAHCLHYALVPRGTLNNYYSDDVRMSRPEPELLFGEFVYSGEIRVFVAADSVEQEQAQSVILEPEKRESESTATFKSAPSFTAPQELAANIERGSSIGQQIVKVASQQVGQEYVWGGESHAEGGFDCSGLVDFALRQAGYQGLRITAETVKNMGHSVLGGVIAPGDLVLTNHGQQVVIYAGGGKVISAPHTGALVRYQPISDYNVTDIRRPY